MYIYVGLRSILFTLLLLAGFSYLSFYGEWHLGMGTPPIARCFPEKERANSVHMIF